MMPFKRQALVEFDSVESAERCVTRGANEAVYIAEQQAFFNFSTSQRITRPTNADDPTSKNKVLLLSIQNPLYPITTVSAAFPYLWLLLWFELFHLLDDKWFQLIYPELSFHLFFAFFFAFKMILS